MRRAPLAVICAVCCSGGCAGDSDAGGPAGSPSDAAIEGSFDANEGRGEGDARPPSDAATGEGGTPRTTMADGGQAAAPAGDSGQTDAGTIPSNDWAPLTTAATPTCTHPPAPAGFEPVAVGWILHEDGSALLMLDAAGMAVRLRCQANPAAPRPRLSPDRRKVQFNNGFVTSWLLDGVFALPQEIDGFEARNFSWANSDFLVTTGQRPDPSSPGDTEHALLLARWDGSVAMRLPGDVRVEGFERDSARLLGANDSLGVYRVDPGDEERFDYYRIEFPSLDTRLLASGIGAPSPTIYGAFDGPNERLVIPVDQGFNFNRLHTLSLVDGTLTDVGGYAPVSVRISPDRSYAVFGSGSSFDSVRLDSETEVHGYPGLYHTSPIVFEPGAHRFAALSPDDELHVADPEHGELGPRLHPPVEQGARGVSRFEFAGDGAGVFFVAELNANEPGSLYYSPLRGPGVALASAPLPKGVTLLPSPDGRSIAYQSEEGSVVVDRDGSVTALPYTADAQTSQVLAWSSTGQHLLYQTSGEERFSVLLWSRAAGTATDLLERVDLVLGGTPTGGVDIQSLLP